MITIFLLKSIRLELDSVMRLVEGVIYIRFVFIPMMIPLSILLNHHDPLQLITIGADNLNASPPDDIWLKQGGGR